MHQEIIDQRPRRVDLKKVVGDDVVITINVKDAGVPVPWAQMSEEHGLKTSQGDDVAVNFTATTLVDGQLTLRLTPANTTELGKGNFVYWASITRNGVELTYVNGEISLKERWDLS